MSAISFHRTASFDLYDTLFVRPVLKPADVFDLVEHELGKPGWARARKTAEREARRHTPCREVNLDGIYRELVKLGYSDCSLEAMKRELAWEAKTRVVPAMASIVEAARREGAKILFISDMYLPRHTIESLLTGVMKPEDRLYLSHEENCGKSSGLWKRIINEHPHPWRHYGDNCWADVFFARAEGVEAVHVTDYHPNLRERQLAKDNPGNPLISGLSRLARALHPVEMDDSWTDGANIVGPVFYSFTRWVMETARERKIPAVYFLARDGELPCEMARMIALNDPELPACHYLHGSRHALYNAAFDLAEPAHYKWMIDAAPPTVRGVLGNLKTAPESIAGWLAAAGYASTTWDQPLDLSARKTLLRILSETPGSDTWCAQRFHAYTTAALRYFEQEKLFSYHHIALVDIGWSGSTLDSFKATIARNPTSSPEVLGMFFGLHRNTGPDRLTFEFCPRLTAHWAQAYPAILEMMVPGSHGQVTGFTWTADSCAQPVLSEKNSAEASVISALHGGALAYVRLALDYGVKSLDYSTTLRETVVCPSKSEAIRWSRFQFGSRQKDDSHDRISLVAPASWTGMLKMFLRPGRNLHRVPWPNASLVIRWKNFPKPLLRLLALKYRAERIAYNLYERLNPSR